MATLGDRTVDGTFASLTSTGVTAIIFLVVGFTLEEYLKRLRRYPDEDKRRASGEEVQDRGSEGWAMGYLYRARTYIPFRPTPDYSTTPTKWIIEAAMLPQSFFEDRIGPDGTCYLRFLRGCFYWILLQAVTVFPILLSINFIYAAPDISTTSIERASLTSLTTSASAGENLLWIHVCCLWTLTVSFYLTLLWVGYGVVRIRRNVLRSLLRGESDSEFNIRSEKVVRDGEQQIEGIQDNAGQIEDQEKNLQVAPNGWRYRTVLIRNIPFAMRSEQQLRIYFHHYLRGGGQPRPFPESTPRNSTSETSTPSPSTPSPSTPNPLVSEKYHSTTQLGSDATEAQNSEWNEEPLIENIVLARKQGELNELFTKYTDVLHHLETSHCVLASNVMEWVVSQVKKEEVGKNFKTSSKIWNPLTLLKRSPAPLDPEIQQVRDEEDQQLLDVLRPFAYANHSQDDASHSIWIALHSLPSHLLDRFQPLYKLKRFRGQSVPSIDYYLTKLNLLASLIEDKRSRPLESEAGSSAFVTFYTASDARRARKEMNVRPGSGNKNKEGKGKKGEVFGLAGKKNLGLEMECKVGAAPEVRDLDWNRLVYVSLRSDIFRGFILNVIIWAATIFWVIPITFLVGLLSLTSTKSPSIAKYIPQLADYLNSHKVTKSLFSNLLPAAIVALLSMLVPTLIGMLTRNGQTFITVSKLHAQVQSRYYKWIIFNIVIVFCVGVSAFTAFLDAFQTPASLLKVVADSFPKGATFFVSWSLLVVGIHHGIETSLFGIPYINHATIRTLRSPRKKESEALPRSFSYFYWVPNHLLVLAVSAIFAILNPLVLAFNLAYFSFALVVFKNQFAHVYWRRNYENNGRLVFRRCFRYSLDLFMVAQVVAVALFEFLKLFKLGAACIPLIPLTAFFKLVGTRWFDSLMDEIDEAEIDVVCGGAATLLPDLSVPLTEKDVDLHHLPLSQALDTLSTFATVTLPALTFRPHARLPSVPSPHNLSEPLRPRSESQPIIPSPTKVQSHLRFLTSTVPEQNQFEVYPANKRKETVNEKVARTELKTRTTFTPLPRSPMNLSAIAVSKEFENGQLFQGDSYLVSVHPPIVRDDRPVTNLRYDNPAVVIPLSRSLWLPRDPLVPLDLGDTVDYRGTCLVSSEGGRGVIGSWDEFLTEDLEQEDEEAEGFGLEEYEATMAVLNASRARPKRSDSAATMEEVIQHRMNRSSSPFAAKGAIVLDGSERIRVAGQVASKVEAEEEAKSFSTPMMLRRNTGTSVDSGSFFPPMMKRRGTGASSLGIDTLRVRGQSPSRASPGILSSSPSRSSPDPLAVVKSPFDSKPLAPRIPSFTNTSEVDHMLDEPSSNSRESTSLIVPPSSLDLSVQSNSLPSRSTSSPLSLQRTRSATGPTYPPTSVLMSSSTVPLARPARSPRIVSNSSIILDTNKGSSISQIAALREELWAEEREESKKRKEKDLKRSEEEKSDKKASWFSKFVLGEVEEAEAGPGGVQDQ